jgi:glycosyltransferase involved in cell wall biosynthesis
MTALPQVSVVVPTHNRRELLTTTLQSLVAQRDVDLEVLVVDDDSADGTVETLAARNHPSVRVLSNPGPRGVATARNLGIASARGEWVAFCDDDDLWAPSKLRHQLDAAVAADSRWAFGGAVSFNQKGEVVIISRPPPPEIAIQRLPWVNVVPGGCSNVLARRDLLSCVGGFDVRLRVLADWELWLRLSRTGGPAIVDAPLVGYRLHESNMSAHHEGVLAEFALVDALGADLRLGSRLETAWLHRWLAQAALRSGRRREAVQSYVRAARRTDLKSWGRPLVALFGHSLSRRVAARLRPIDREWEAQARPWLEELLSPQSLHS